MFNTKKVYEYATSTPDITFPILGDSFIRGGHIERFSLYDVEQIHCKTFLFNR